MTKRSGLTLLELMVALGLTVIVVGAIFFMFRLSAGYMTSGPGRTTEWVQRTQVDQRIRALLERSYLNPDVGDTATYFVATAAGGSTGTPDTLVFTTYGVPAEPAAFDPADTKTFEERNTSFGPQGGLSEVSFSLQSVGQDAAGKSGLFLRTQTPADGDITQGGNEELLIPGIITFKLEFWDGTQWATAWDTRTGARRLPTAVRMTLGTDKSDTAYIYTVTLNNSDVTPTNPAVQS